MRKPVLVASAALLFLGRLPVEAQGALDCQTITNDVLVSDPHAAMPQATGDGSGLGERTSGQILARWATMQDPDPEACVTLKLVQRRLAAEAQFASTQCPDIGPTIRQRIEAANGEAAVMCRK